MNKIIKYLLLLIISISLIGCSSNKTITNEQDIKQEEQVEEETNNSVIVNITPSVKLIYDKDLKVVEVVELDDNATQTWSDLSLVGKKLSEAVNLLLSQAKEKEVITDNQVKISLSTEDVEAEQTLTETVNTYVSENKDVQVIVNETTVSGEEKVVVETPEPITEDSYIGIWEMESWTNPSIWTGMAVPRVIVLMDGNIGYDFIYDVPVEESVSYSTVLWDENSLTYTHGGSRWVDFWKENLGDYIDENGVKNNYSAIELKDGKLIQILSENEIVTYKKVDYYNPPLAYDYNGHYWNFIDFKADYDAIVAVCEKYGV